jgi:hypothetical protein
VTTSTASAPGSPLTTSRQPHPSRRRPKSSFLLGNQVVATLTAACCLAQALPNALLLFSGGIGHATRLLVENLRVSDFAPLLDDAASSLGEAELYALVAQRAFSIPADRIRVEPRSTNGGENARFSLRLLREAGLADAPVILLQDPLMQRRTVLTWLHESEKAGRHSQVLSHPSFIPKVEPGPNAVPRLIPTQSRDPWTFDRYLGMLLGEIARLRDDENGYGPRGKNFLPHVDIPAEVWASYESILLSPLAKMVSR